MADSPGRPASLDPGTGPLLQIAVLGEPAARRGRRDIPLGGPRRQALLCVLAMRANQCVAREEIIGSLWGQDSPPSADANIRTYAAGLRRLLAAGQGDVLHSRRSGYVLTMDTEQLDAHAFDTRLRQSRRQRGTGQLEDSAQSLESALSLWRGLPLSGVTGPFAETQRTRLTETHIMALEERADLMLAMGRAEITAELRALILEHPFRERLRAQLMLALYRSGQQASALTLYHDTRRLLTTQLGVEPGPQLKRMQHQILTCDPALDLPGWH